MTLAFLSGRVAVSGGRGLLLPLVILGVLGLLAALGPLLWRVSPVDTDLSVALFAPTVTHPMGTDLSGRDVLARFLVGARVSLLGAFAVMCVSGVVGVIVGVVAGMLARFGGVARPASFVDAALMRLMDVVLAFPQLILAMAVVIALGHGVLSALIGAAVGCVPVFARLVRAEVVQLRQRQFVFAARMSGLSPMRVVWCHVLPHLRPVVLVQGSAVFGTTIVTLAGLSFVGLGVPLPAPEWGSMIAEGLAASLSGAWWVVLFPGFGLVVAVAGANILADRLSAGSEC